MSSSREFLAASVIVISFSLPVVAQSDTATLAWELDGFDTPESAFYDSARNVIYVSNIVGEPTERDGMGHISRVSVTGEMLEAEWVTGLEAPKGLVLDGDTLYVADLDGLVAIDVESGKVTGTWAADNPQFLNDTAVDGDGRVFVSDMASHTIHVLVGDTLAVWLQDEALQHPNGLRIDGGKLVVAAWGQKMKPDFSVEVPGHLLTVDLETKEIAALGSGEPIGMLDGLEPDGDGAWLVTDWVNGALLRIQNDGSVEQLLDLDMGSADLGYVPDEKLVIIPMMLDDKVVAYRLD